MQGYIRGGSHGAARRIWGNDLAKKVTSDTTGRPGGRAESSVLAHFYKVQCRVQYCTAAMGSRNKQGGWGDNEHARESVATRWQSSHCGLWDDAMEKT
ncbi:hypothetical protein EXIGLDRAFT_736093 [Exidia glandulosa HHB12029]|uniref:Uncharacterized protein n=1 Tax=Exidia glandulosa HHB12029 TaxID=1314781 RepID=A0A165JLY6_EXIGL|nr:hypothetical protein EXIGLDRAFT_736093 [Exidia glandulosa HHB12029]